MEKIQGIEQSAHSQRKHALTKPQWDKILSNMEGKEEGGDEKEGGRTFAALSLSLRELRLELTRLLQSQERQDHWLGFPVPTPQPAMRNVKHEYNAANNTANIVKEENNTVTLAVIVSIAVYLEVSWMPHVYGATIDLDCDGDADTWDIHCLFAIMAGIFGLGWAAGSSNSHKEPGSTLHRKIACWHMSCSMC
jgi:hypothetical protein